jgi:hypothetical protein
MKAGNCGRSGVCVSKGCRGGGSVAVPRLQIRVQSTLTWKRLQTGLVFLLASLRPPCGYVQKILLGGSGKSTQRVWQEVKAVLACGRAVVAHAQLWATESANGQELAIEAAGGLASN